MTWRCRGWRVALTAGVLFAAATSSLLPQQPASRPGLQPPSAAEVGRPFPINLPTALQLVQVRPLDIQIAQQRLEAARAQLDRANVLWLPNLTIGADYARQDGRLQDVRGAILTTSKSSYLLGAGPTMIFNFSDAIYAPLAARQIVDAHQAGVQAQANDLLLAVAEAYFTVQQARGELAAATLNAETAKDLVRRAEQLAAGLAPAVEVNRVKTELARRQIDIEKAAERWQTTSAELARILRLESAVLVDPQEPPQLRVELLDLSQPVDTYIPTALVNRPELAERQALVQATLRKLDQEKLRPLVPSLVLRGNATNPGGNLAGGYFGGGINDRAADFGGRGSFDAQLVWEFQNLGFGNHAAVRERTAQSMQATLELFRIQDQIAAEVVQAHAQAKRAANRVTLAEEGLRNAVVTMESNLQGMTQTKRSGELLVLIFRPQEVVAALQSLDASYKDYFAAIADANRAQFRFYRALGHPAQCVLQTQAAREAAPPKP